MLKETPQVKRTSNLSRILDLVTKKQPDRDRWGDPASYGGEHWDSRAKQAARLVPDGARILEIGVGKGTFRDEVTARCSFVGADLNPLDSQTLAINLDSDPLPAGEFDFIVLLGVVEYLHNLGAVIEKLRAGAPHLLMSYCCIPGDAPADTVVAARRERGWVNDLTVSEFRALFGQAPFTLTAEEPYKTPGPFWDQRIYLFDRQTV
jgi:hypothetical protein